VLVTAFVNFYVFPLWVEVILLPVAMPFAGVAALAESKSEFAGARLIANGFLGMLGFTLIVYVSAHAASHAGAHLLHRLALPIWLGLAVLPYTYLVGLYAAYEVAFLQIQVCDPGPYAQRRAKIALLLGVGARAHNLAGFGRLSAGRLVAAPSLRAARQLAAGLRAEGNY
jgi:uncharacterized membrane protein